MIRRLTSVTVAVLAAVCIVEMTATAWRRFVLEDAAHTGMFFVTMVVVGQGAGLVMTWRRPSSRGVLVQVTALTIPLWVAGPTSSALALVWLVTASAPSLLAVRWPGIAGRRRRQLVDGLSLVVVLTGVAFFLVERSSSGSGLEDAPRPLAMGGPAHALLVASAVALGVIVVVTGASAAHALVRSRPADRRVLWPVALPAVGWSLLVLLSALRAHGDPVVIFGAPALAAVRFVPSTLDLLIAVAAGSLVTGVVWLELVLPRWERTRDGIEARPFQEADVDAYVARALGDPSVEVYFPGTHDGTWISVHGHETVIPDDPDRATTTVTRLGRVLAAVTYDAALLAEPETVELVLTAAARAIAAQNQTAIASADAEAARELTSRLLTATQRARTQLQGALREGPIRALAAVEQQIGTGPITAAVADQLSDIGVQVRRISRGLLPSELEHAGLRAALPGAEVRTARRFSSPVEITAYLAAADDPTASIDEAEGLLVIRLGTPPGDPELRDRIEILGGEIDGPVVTLPVEG